MLEGLCFDLHGREALSKPFFRKKGQKALKKLQYMALLGFVAVCTACGAKGRIQETRAETSLAESGENGSSNDKGDAGTESESAGTEDVDGKSEEALSKAKIKLKYSNLVDQETRERVKTALMKAGLKEEKVKSFFEAVDEYNNAAGKENLVQEMTTIDAGFPSFDSDKLVDNWLEKGGYVGRNCRITSFSLMGDFIKVGNPVSGDTTMLFSDFDAISAKQIFSAEAKKNFDTLFSYIDVEDTKDTSALSEEIIKSWKKKEISFDNDKMHMVSVFMTMDDGLNKVQEFIGHVGVLVEDGDKFLFIEKLAFELPYQVEEFSDLQELNDYLMGYYDKDADGLTAKPIIFWDGEVMKEYRVLEG